MDHQASYLYYTGPNTGFLSLHDLGAHWRALARLYCNPKKVVGAIAYGDNVVDMACPECRVVPAYTSRAMGGY